jgi:transcriptional antiterminator NusG
MKNKNTNTAEEKTIEALEEQAQAENNSIVEAKGDWYILHTYSMHEKKVERGINQAVEMQKLGDRVFKVVVPEEETIEVKDGNRIERKRKLFPGYVFVNMSVDDEVWSTIRRIPGVLKFVGSANSPEAVSDDEMLKVLRRMGVKSKRIEVDFELGENIKIISGPFRGYTGTINEISGEKGKLKTLISIFGRETPVELTFDQVEKAS